MNPARNAIAERLECRRHFAAAPPASNTTDWVPDEIYHAYGFDQVSLHAANATVPGDGRGQTIAVVVAYHSPTLKQDLRGFDAQYGLPDRTPAGQPVLKLSRQAGTPPNSAWALETATDVEWAHAIAPAARILVVEARSDSPADLFKAVDRARRRRGVSVVSMSWGWDTAPAGFDFQNLFSTPRGHVGSAGKRGGVTFVGAAADHGATNAWPDSSISVVSVGGTALTLNGADYGSETRLPQCNTPATVAYAATGFSVYQGGAWQSPGGTSAAAPQWAALFAIADQGRGALHKPSLDGASQILPALAGMPSEDFHPVIDGGTLSGRGSPFADRIIADLVSI